MSKDTKDTIGIAIVAPGGYAPEAAAYARGLDALRKLGWRVHAYYEHAARQQRFGGSDEARAAQLHAAASDPDVNVVMALRGGYGTSRLLPLLDFPMLAASGKLFVGHSDFTAFQMALLAAAGAPSLAGPMVCDDFSRESPSEFTLRHFLGCVSDKSCAVSWREQGNPAVDVAGTLWGGNLAMLTHLAGTPWLPQIDGGILFVEDVNEHPYRVERMLLQLLHAGVLVRQKALVLGDFSGYRLTEYDNGYDFSTMLDWLRTHLPLPVVTGLPFGHIRDKATLPVGCHGRLIATSEEARIEANIILPGQGK